MMRKISLILLVSLFVGGFAAFGQSAYPGLFSNKFKVGVKPMMKTQCFDLREVRLLPGRFYDNMKRDSAWMMSIPVKSLLHSFRNNAGVFSGNEGGYYVTKKLGGWESLDCDLRGHITGHLLSANALMYAATGSVEFKLKGDSLVSGLAEVQQALGVSGYLSAFPEELINRNIQGKSVWAPWYTLHKILSGLIDQYLYADNQTALTAAEKMCDWAYAKVSSLDQKSIQKMIKNEYGGINESFYNVYALTGNARFLKLAQLFYKADNIDPLKSEKDELGTLHANTFIPKVLAEARNYELTGEMKSKNCAEYFLHLMTGQYSFVTGEVGDHEHFFNPQTQSQHLTGYDGENCCTYNLLKLCKHLFCWNGNEEVMDYYECALYNHILGQQDPASGMVCYFTPLLSGAYKVYSTPNDSYWCCVGSGFENHAKYAESIYSHNDNGIYVNLFISSVLNWKEKGITLRQTSDFPQHDIIKINITESSSIPWTLYLRYPEWAKHPSVRINGKSFAVKQSAGSYICINRKWKKGDEVTVCYPMQLNMVASADDPHRVALKYGPVVLAGELGSSNMSAPAPFSDPKLYNDYYRYDFHIPEGLDTSLSKSDLKSIKKTSDKLEFVTESGVKIKPLYDIHHERYVVYWTTK